MWIFETFVIIIICIIISNIPFDININSIKALGYLNLAELQAIVEHISSITNNLRTTEVKVDILEFHSIKLLLAASKIR